MIECWICSIIADGGEGGNIKSHISNLLLLHISYSNDFYSEMFDTTTIKDGDFLINGNPMQLGDVIKTNNTDVNEYVNKLVTTYFENGMSK